MGDSRTDHGVSVRTQDLFSLRGKTVIGTGLTGGIGLPVTVSLAEAGASIVSIEVPNDPNSKAFREAIEAAGQSVRSFECDLMDAASISRCFNDIWADDVVPDILFHAAGMSYKSPVVETSVETMNRVIDLNIKAAYLVCQAFGQQMIKLGRKGKVINIASMAADLVQEDINVYSGSKAFVRSMTRGMSNEWARHGIQVNSISPGWIETGLCRGIAKDPEFHQYVIDRTSSKRWGQAEDLRGVVIFLASAASDFVTGADILIDGGVLFR